MPEKHLKQGLTFIDDRNNQFRYADKEEFIQWTQPLSAYKAATKIKRGQAVSIATEVDLKEIGKRDFNDENKFIIDDPDPYIVPTDTSRHSKSIGLALEPVAEDDIGTKRIHVQGFGCFTFDTKRDKDAITTGLVYDPKFKYSDVGKKVYVANKHFTSPSGDVITEAGCLTVNQDDIYKSYHNFILLGYLTDAPKDDSQNITKIEISIQGDDRGPIDNTVFEGILGEDVIISSFDPCKVFALGQEEDKAFKAKIAYTPHRSYDFDSVKDKAFIGFQKMDGKTVLITFDNNFSIEKVQNSMVQEDAAFLTIGNIYLTALNKNNNTNEQIKVVNTSIINKPEKQALYESYTNIYNSINEAITYLTEDGIVNLLTYNEDYSEKPSKPVINEDYFNNKVNFLLNILAKKVGGYYYMYISSALAPLFENSVTLCNGSSSNKGKVVIADCRIKERQNIIGVMYNNKYDTLIKKDTICLFMHDGLFLHNGIYLHNGLNKPTPETFENYIGQELFLGRNGTLVRFPLEAYDTVLKIADIQDSKKLLIHCDNARVKNTGGDLPVGYMKPGILAGSSFVAEYGFLLMDGKSRYPYKNYEMLYKRLLAWYPEPTLKKGKLKIGEDNAHQPIYEPEEMFTIPKCTTVTELSETNIMQIKATRAGIYEQEPRIPYIRKFGNFQAQLENAQINDNIIGLVYPTIDKYKVTYYDNGNKLSSKEIDDRFDISAICDLCVKIDGVEEPGLENLDIHLYVNPYFEDDNPNNAYQWVEIFPGFHNFNNTTTYGFEWKITKEPANDRNIYGTWYLSTDIKTGMGIYYHKSGNVVPTSLAGKPWKIAVTRRENIAQQFDLNGVMNAYLSNLVEDENSKPYTNKAVTGQGVITAIENRYRVRKLVGFENEAEILLGEETRPIKKLNLSASEEIPVYSPTGIKFENTLKEDKKEDQKLYYKDNELTYSPATDEFGNIQQLKKIADMKPNSLITRAQSEEHSNSKIKNDDGTYKVGEVHGLEFGIGGNIDASLINGIKLASHNSMRISSKNDLPQEFKDAEHPSYVSYVYYGTDPVSGVGNNYISNHEGITRHLPIALSGTNAITQFASDMFWTEHNTKEDEELFFKRFVNGNYRTFTEEVKGLSNDNNLITVKTRYNFNAGNSKNNIENQVNNLPAGQAYDLEFIKVVDNGQEIPASVRVGALSIASKADYKKILGEDKNSFAGFKNDLPVDYHNNPFTEEGAKKDHEGKYISKEYLNSALQAVYELPLALWQYKNEPSWYKKYIGIIVERINNVKNDLTTTDERNIFNKYDQEWNNVDSKNKKVKSKVPFSKADNTYKYTADEIKSIQSYLNLITDNSESSQNIISTVGLLLKAAKETQERLLKVEASTFGADASTIPGSRDKIKFAEMPDITSEATHLGLNRLIRAMSIELFKTANPFDDKNLSESNDTSTSLSRLDELETELEGKTFDKDVQQDAADNKLEDSSKTYPYSFDKEKSHGNNIVLTGETVESKVVEFDQISGRDKTKVIYDTASQTNTEIQETEEKSKHGTWTKIYLEKNQDFKDDFETGTATNLVPNEDRFKFNGVIDAISRICTKLNALTYTINGIDNINSTPKRLNTIRSNIETLIKEAYFDGKPITVFDEASNSIHNPTTELDYRQYKDQDLDYFDADLPQPSTPYEQKGSTYNNTVNKYTGLSRFDQLSKNLFDYILTTRKDEHKYTLNGKNNNPQGSSSSIEDGKLLQYTDKDGEKGQVLLGRKFNGKRLLVSGIGDKVNRTNAGEYDKTGAIKSGVETIDLDGSAVQNKNVSVQINVPDSIEEYNFANIIDVLIDAIGPAYFRQIFDQEGGKAYSDQILRETRTITTRLENLEKALDNVVKKLSQSSSFETDSKKTDDSISSNYPSSKTYSIEEFINRLNIWLGLSVLKNGTEWTTSKSAEVAAGYGNDRIHYAPNVDGTGKYYFNTTTNEYVKGTDPNGGQTYDKVEDDNYYLDTSKPVINSNYIIKQLLKRLRFEENYSHALKKVLGEDYKIERALGGTPKIDNDSDGKQKYKYPNEESHYNLTDDIKDLLLTVYGTDIPANNNSPSLANTDYKHRTNVQTANFLDLKVWKKVGGNQEIVFTNSIIKLNSKIFKKSDVKEVESTIATIEDGGNTIVDTNGYKYTIITDPKVQSEALSVESTGNSNTRFAGSGNTRNIVNDIIHEMYYVPKPVEYTDSTKSSEYVDSINITYDKSQPNEKHVYYDIDSGIYSYDYEKNTHDNTETEGRTGAAIGYNNRGTLFNDYLNSNAKYRKSRMQVLEDEIRHLRKLIGLDKIKDNKDNSNITAVNTKYGGHFAVTNIGELAGTKFGCNATRNGNLYTDNDNKASGVDGKPYENANQDINLLTLLFNIDNAIKDISRELGVETNYLGKTTSLVNTQTLDYEKFEQLNKEREMPIYARLKALEDLTGSILGLKNRAAGNNNAEAENEEDYATDEGGVLAIQWLEE